MNKKLVITLLFALSAIVATAQQMRLSVVDKDSRQPVAFVYANIYLQHDSLQQALQADENGILTVTPALYPCKIKLSVIGYEPYTLSYMTAPVGTEIQVQLNKKSSSLDEVVVTGLAQPTRLKDALSNYQVITQATIRSQGAVTLNDVLKNQLNMNISNDAVLGSGVNMQVIGGDKVKILIDGMPVNGRENGNINLSQINLNNVDRIEVIQGPMSIVYGSDAVGGIINVITKKEKSPFDINIKAYYESIGKYNSTASTTFKLWKRHQVTLGGGRNMFVGYENIDQPKWYNGDTVRTKRAFLFKPNTQNLANFAYNYSTPSGFRLNLSSDYVKDKTTNKSDLQTFDPFNGARATDEYYTTDRSMNRLSAEGKQGKTGHWTMQNGYALYCRVKNRYAMDMNTLNQSLTTNMGDQDTSKFDNITARGSYDNSLKKLKYTIGYDVNLEYVHSLKIVSHYEEIKDYAVYTNLSYPVLKDKLTAQVGARAAINSRYHPPVIPSVNLLFTPLNKLQLRASYAQGYRAPSLKELYLSFIDNITHDITGNPNLTAEQSEHLQLSASYQFYEKKADYLNFILTNYYNEVKNGIALVNMVPNTIKYTYQNVAHQSNLITTFQADGQWRNIHAVLGYSYRHNFAEPGQYNAYGASEATATVQYGWHLTGVNFNLFYKYTGVQPFIVYNDEGIAKSNGVQAAYSLMDASVERRFINKKVQIIVGMKNIFDLRSPAISGAVMVSSHGGGGGQGVGNLLPRSFFTSLNVNLD